MITEENVLYEVILDTWIQFIERMLEKNKWIFAMNIILDILKGKSMNNFTGIPENYQNRKKTLDFHIKKIAENYLNK